MPVKPALVVAATLLASCADLAGVDQYSVQAAPKPRDVVASFLAGRSSPLHRSCQSCLLDVCDDDVGACAADASCLASASCIRACSGLGPHCALYGCAGAQPPRDPRLEDLVQCAQDSCLEQCAIGRDFSCTGQYSLPRAPGADFDLELRFSIFVAGDALADATVRLCREGSAFLVCEGSDQLATSRTDLDGVVKLPVHLERSATAYAVVPKGYLYVDRTQRSLADGGVAVNTLGDRIEMPLLPFADPISFPLLRYSDEFPGIAGTVRFFNGVVLDCRGLIGLGARGLQLSGDPVSVAYWDNHTNSPARDATTLAGIFTTPIGLPDGSVIVPAGPRSVSLVDAESGEERITGEVTIPAEGHVGRLFFPAPRK